MGDSSRDVLQALRGLLQHRTDDLGCYEFVLESWIESAADEIERLRGYRDLAEADRDIAMLAAERLRLTDADRDAIAVAMHRCDGPEYTTLRALLERTAAPSASVCVEDK